MQYLVGVEGDIDRIEMKRMDTFGTQFTALLVQKYLLYWYKTSTKLQILTQKATSTKVQILTQKALLGFDVRVTKGTDSGL